MTGAETPTLQRVEAMAQRHIAPSPEKGALLGIQALRGVAAVSVLAYHVARHVDRAEGAPRLVAATRFGHAGVDLFFVVSGFVILFVHGKDVGRPDRLPHYAGRRFSRVMPLYWIALLCTVAMDAAGGHAAPPPRILWSATLLPSFGEPVLGVAWTLQYEVLFYAVFALLILRRGAGLAVLAFWFCWIALSWAGVIGPAGPIPPAVHGAYNIEFFLGMAVAGWLRGGTVRRPALIAGAGLVMVSGACLAETARVLDGYAPEARLVYGLASAVLVLGLVALERDRGLAVPRWLGVLGGASYAIYLFQFVLIGLAWKLLLACRLAAHLPAWTVFAMLMGAALGGGIAARRWIEAPLLHLARGTARAPLGLAR